MRMAGLELNLLKCVFATPSVKCLGYIVSKQRGAPDPDKIACIVSMPWPTNSRRSYVYCGHVCVLLSVH